MKSVYEANPEVSIPMPIPGVKVPIPFILPATLHGFVAMPCFAVAGDFCFISLLGRATYIWAEDRYELHVVKYSRPNRKR